MVPVTAMMMAVVINVVTAVMASVVPAMMASVVPAMTVTGKRRHRKQQGSRYCTNEREPAKHEFLPWSARDPLSLNGNVNGAAPVPNAIH